MKFIDAREVPDHTTFEVDLAIIGGGPAGITIARSLANSKIKICLVESGGLDYDPDVQALYEGESIGLDYSLTNSRMRYFGGSSNHWGGFCRPLYPVDFEYRDWVPYSGWPLDYSEVDKYYPAASELVEVAPGKYKDGAYWQEKTGEDLLQFKTGRMDIEFVHYSPPTRFGTRYLEDLQRAANIQVLLNANVTNIAADDSGKTIKHLTIQTLAGGKLKVKATRFVLAAGGLENPRLMLLSNDVVTPGLGNENDLVGRFFMEHPHISGFGEMVMADIKRLPSIYRERLIIDGRTCKISFTPSASYMRQKQILNATFQMGIAGFYGGKNPSPIGDPDKALSHSDMLKAARYFISDPSKPLDPDNPSLDGMWLGIGCACEQVPNPDSRVTLSDKVDALGLRKISLDWRLTEQDKRSLLENMRSLGSEFGALGIGRLILNIEDDGIWPEHVEGGNHHMGTTRMSENRKSGVVDKNCKVHGIDNLYIAGSSVFPTIGTSNPTLTIVALALRLTDHLKERYS